MGVFNLVTEYSDKAKREDARIDKHVRYLIGRPFLSRTLASKSREGNCSILCITMLA